MALLFQTLCPFSMLANAPRSLPARSGHRSRSFALAFALALPLCLAPGCQTVEETGRWQLALFNEEDMAQLGAEAYVEATKDYPTITGTPEAEMVQRVGRRIAEAVDKDKKVEYAWEFKLLDAPEVVNAFALPGGKIAVYSGLLKVTETEDALAAVVGHEIAHATSNHGNERMSHHALANAGMATAQLALSGWEEGDATTKTAIMTGLGVATQIGAILPYSRKHESEADEIGLRFLVRAGYDPHAAPALWRRMAAQSGSGATLTLLSTHPDPNDRAEALEKLIPKIVQEESGKKP